MADEVFVVMSTFPSLEEARRVGRQLVEEALVACVNLVPGIESIYRWKGALQTESEVLLLMKTTSMCLAPLQARLRELHPYEVPELVALPVASGMPAYLQWVVDSCR